MPDLDSCISFPIDEATLNDVVQKAKDWALMHGAAMRSKANFSEDSLQVTVQSSLAKFAYVDNCKLGTLLFLSFISLQFAPFILLPTLFPRREFEKAVRLQPILNELMHWVAHDTEFLRETLANTIKVDEFTRNLFEIHERILAENDSAQVCSVRVLIR